MGVVRELLRAEGDKAAPVEGECELYPVEQCRIEGTTPLMIAAHAGTPTWPRC